MSLLVEENIECQNTLFKICLGPVAKNATLGLLAGNSAHDLANSCDALQLMLQYPLQNYEIVGAMKYCIV